MGKKKKQQLGECVYCGKLRELTRDHIPPQNLFPEPRPRNLITVPSCKPCNGNASKDDEYFRLSLTIREDLKGQPARDAVFSTVLRSLGRPKAKGLARAFWKDTAYATRVSPTGLYLGTGMLYTAKVHRMEAVAIRIVRGLVFSETGRRVPDDYCVRTMHLSRLTGLNLEERQMTEEFIDALLNTQPEEIGDVFQFSRLWSPKGWPRSVWLLAFYGRVEYLCIIGPLNLEGIDLSL